MASAKQIANQKRFARRAKRGDFKKAIAKSKKSNPHSKKRELKPSDTGYRITSKAQYIKSLESRLATIENKLNSVLLKGAGDYTYQAEMIKDPEFQVGLKLRDDLKRELDEGRNG